MEGKRNMFASEWKRVGVGGAEGSTSCQEELRRETNKESILCVQQK